MRYVCIAACACWLASGCSKGAAEPPPVAPTPVAPASTPASAPAPVEPAPDTVAAKTEESGDKPALAPASAPAIPTTCAGSAEACVPPSAFAEAVCNGRFPDLSLYLFAKGTPWQRAYVKVQHLEPVNLYAGERSDRWLEFGEEVLILKRRGPGSGKKSVEVSGPTDLDVLRFDGTCATVRQEMLATYMTGAVRVAPVVWKYLDPDIQEALLKDKGVARASDKERPACKGSTMKHPGEPCVKAMTALSDAIGVALRLGVAVPAPDKLPRWQP